MLVPQLPILGYVLKPEPDMRWALARLDKETVYSQWADSLLPVPIPRITPRSRTIRGKHAPTLVDYAMPPPPVDTSEIFWDFGIGMKRYHLDFYLDDTRLLSYALVPDRAEIAISRLLMPEACSSPALPVVSPTCSHPYLPVTLQRQNRHYPRLISSCAHYHLSGIFVRPRVA